MGPFYAPIKPPMWVRFARRSPVGEQREYVENLAERTQLGRGVDRAVVLGRTTGRRATPMAHRSGHFVSDVAHSQAVRTAGRAAATGVAAVGVVAAGLAAVSTAAVATAAAATAGVPLLIGLAAAIILDPVLIVGDRVLVGWE